MSTMTVLIIIIAVFVLASALRVPVAFGLLLACAPFLLLHPQLSTELMVQRMYAGLDSFILLAVPFFIFAASIMTASGITEKLIDFARATVGWIRRGLGIVNVGASIGFSGMSGSSTADVAGTGSVLIPQMIKRGYPAGFTVGITAASAVISSVIPPSIQLIVWGSLTNTSIGSLFLGGLVPGLMMGVGMMLAAYLVARRKNYPRESSFEAREAGRTFVKAVPALGIIVIVLGGFRLGWVTATEAALLAVAYSLFLALVVYRTVSVRDLGRVLVSSAKLTSVALFALGAATVLAYVLTLYQVPRLFQGVVDAVPGWALLGVVVLILFVIGLFMAALPAMAIMIPVLGPAVVLAGLDPVHYGIVAVMTLALGLITPPVGICLLVASSIGKIPVLSAVRPMMPFFFVMVAVIVLCVVFPQIVTFLPNLLGA